MNRAPDQFSRSYFGLIWYLCILSIAVVPAPFLLTLSAIGAIQLVTRYDYSNYLHWVGWFLFFVIPLLAYALWQGCRCGYCYFRDRRLSFVIFSEQGVEFPRPTPFLPWSEIKTAKVTSFRGVISISIELHNPASFLDPITRLFTRSVSIGTHVLKGRAKPVVEAICAHPNFNRCGAAVFR